MSTHVDTAAGSSWHTGMPGESTAATSATSQIDSEVGLVSNELAGYARVSTDHEEQASSYEAQVDYYTAYINSRDDWEFAGIYTDEGISATNTKK